MTSVHTFASDPKRGVFILALLVIVIGGSLVLFALRGPALKTGGLFQPISREGGLLLNNLLLTTAAAAVLLGTLYPLLLDAVGGGKVSVGPPFFEAVFIPLMVPLLAVMAVGPFLAWKRGDLVGALARQKAAAVAVVVVALGTWYLFAGGPALAALGMAAAAWLFVGTLTELAGRLRLFRVPLAESLRRLSHLQRSSWGMTVAHAGLAVAVAGMTASSAWKVERIQSMKPGETVTVAGYEFTFEGAPPSQWPELRRHPGHLRGAEGRRGRRHARAGTAVLSRPREPDHRGRHPRDASRRPLRGDRRGRRDGRRLRHPALLQSPGAVDVVGVLIMVGGGLASLSDRRHRVGAPARRQAAGRARPVGA